MNHVITDGVRDDTSLIIGVCGASGSGKTVTAMRLATGLAGGEDIGFVDTEAGRARHYFPTPGDKRSASELLREHLYRVKYLDLRPPYTPANIWSAINAVIDAGAKVVVVDSMSDEWEGEGGLHDMHYDEISRLARKPMADLQEWELTKYNFPAWNVPKSAHKTHLMKNLRQVRAHVIFCFRAEEKTAAVQVEENGRKKTAIVNAGWTPIAEKRMLFDMSISFIVTPDNPGVPLMRDGKAVFGKLNPPFLQFFPEGQQVSEAVGAKLRQWARGESSSVQSTSSPAGGAGTVESSQTVPADPSLLTAYHARLSGEAFKDDLAAAHAEFKPKFDGQPAAIMEAAKRILNAHKDRIAGNSDSESTAGYVQGFIDEVAA
jgi:hypothetical protein